MKTATSRLEKIVRIQIILALLFTFAACGATGDEVSNDGKIAPSGIKLTWSAVTLNSDDTAITDLEGYKVYYGTSSGTYPSSKDAGDVTRYTLSGLVGGTTYFIVVRAYDTASNESAPSSEVNKVF